MEKTVKNVTPAITSLLVVVGLGVGFCGGVWYQKSQDQKNATNWTTARNGQRLGSEYAGAKTAGQGGSGFSNRGGMIFGEVTAKDDKSLTIKTADGGSKMIILTSTTVYRLATEADLNKVEIGKTVAISGKTNTDGTATATSVEINPALGKMPVAPPEN